MLGWCNNAVAMIFGVSSFYVRSQQIYTFKPGFLIEYTKGNKRQYIELLLLIMIILNIYDIEIEKNITQKKENLKHGYFSLLHLLMKRYPFGKSGLRKYLYVYL